jgi:hypothetical protein
VSQIFPKFHNNGIQFQTIYLYIGTSTYIHTTSVFLMIWDKICWKMILPPSIIITVISSPFLLMPLTLLQNIYHNLLQECILLPTWLYGFYICENFKQNPYGHMSESINPLVQVKKALFPCVVALPDSFPPVQTRVARCFFGTTHQKEKNIPNINEICIYT